MKKLMSIVVAVLLIACMACPAFAAGSNDSPVDIAAKDATGAEVKVEVSAPTQTFAVPTDKAAEVTLGGEKVAAGDLSVVYAQDLSVDPAKLPVTITFEVPAAGANDILHVMHYNGTTWEQVAKATGSSVTATFTSLSPVAVVLQTVKTSTTPSTGDSEKPTSPQTGMDMTALFASVAVMLMAGTVAFVAKKHVKD